MLSAMERKRQEVRTVTALAASKRHAASFRGKDPNEDSNSAITTTGAKSRTKGVETAQRAGLSGLGSNGPSPRQDALRPCPQSSESQHDSLKPPAASGHTGSGGGGSSSPCRGQGHRHRPNAG